jgi:hypothetical protein
LTELGTGAVWLLIFAFGVIVGVIADELVRLFRDIR